MEADRSHIGLIPKLLASSVVTLVNTGCFALINFLMLGGSIETIAYMTFAFGVFSGCIALFMIPPATPRKGHTE